jgi:tetratricopeptide (TPR) repeat protein
MTLFLPATPLTPILPATHLTPATQRTFEVSKAIRGSSGVPALTAWAGALQSKFTRALTFETVVTDEKLSPDGGVVKHKVREGEGYEKATDGAKLTFLYRILSAPRGAGRVRETDTEEEAARRSVPAGKGGGGAGAGGGDSRSMDWAYDKWSKMRISDDGEIEEVIPLTVGQALADSQKSKDEAGNSEVLFESWDPSKPNVVYCGFGETAEGLEDALVTMKKNEHAIITIAATHGFAAHDRGPPCADLPTDRALHFEVLLLEIGKGYEHWNLDVDGKRMHGTRKRVRGNEFFKLGNFRRALKLYQPIVDKMGYFMKMPKRPSEAASAQAKAANEQYLKQGQKIHNVASSLESDDTAVTEEERALKRELQTPCYLNIAACRSKLGDEKGCIEACNGALKLEEGNIKALYRRATAQIVLCNYEEARADLQMLLQLDAKNADALRELARIHRLEEQARAKVSYYSGFV